MSRIIRKNIGKLIIVSIIICIILAISFPLFSTKSTELILINSRNTVPIGEITNGMVIEQTFTCPKDDLNSIGLLFATYAHPLNKGKVHISVYNTKNNLICETSVKTEDILDNSFINVNIPNEISSKNQKYTVEITTDCVNGNAPTIWANTSNHENMRLLIDKKVSDCNLIMNVQCMSKNLKVILFSFYFVLIAAGLFTLLSLVDSVDSQKHVEEVVK